MDRHFLLLLNLLRCAGFYLPGVYLGGQLGGAHGVFIGIALANAAMEVVAIFSLRRIIGDHL